MKYPNAFKGVKKLFTAQLLSLLGTVTLIVAAIVALCTVSTSQGETSFAAAALGLAAIFVVISCIAFILKLAGLSAGGKDEPLFKTALFFAIAGIVINGLDFFLSSELAKNIGSILIPVTEVLLIYYVICAIRSLAEKLGDSDMAQRAKRVTTIVFVTFGVGLLAQVLGRFVFTGTLDDALKIVGYVLEIVQFVVYLSYLARAKKTLAQ